MMNKHFNTLNNQAVTVATTIVKEYNWQDTLESIGTAHAISSVNITTEAAGMVERIHFRSGDKIEKGDVLVELNRKTDQAKLDALKAAYKLAMQDFTRAQQLAKTKSISVAEIDNKRSIVEQTLAQVIMQNELIQQKVIRAPFSGELGIRQIDVGEYLSPGEAVVSLQSLDPIYVNFSIPEQDLYKFKIGASATIRIAAVQDLMFTGRITAIEPQAETTTRNFNIQATFNNKDFLIRPGMFAAVLVTLGNAKKVLAIPREAISYNPYGNHVYIVQKDLTRNEAKVIKRFIKLGKNNNDLVEVVDGLTVGDEVVTSGLLKLRNQAKININNSIARVKK